jgi:hypothetical protein
MVQFNSVVSLLIFFGGLYEFYYEVSCWFFGLDDLYTDKNGLLRPPTIIVFNLTCPFISNSISAIACTKVQWIYICNCFIFLMDCSFINMWWPSLSLLTNFGLKSALSDISISAPTCFQIPFAQNIIFHFFHFQSLIFASEVSFVYTEISWIMFFYTIQLVCVF